MTEYHFTDAELLELSELQELWVTYERLLQRRIGYLAKEHGIDPTKNQIHYDIVKGILTYEPLKATES